MYIQYLFGICNCYFDEVNRTTDVMSAINRTVDTMIESNTNGICDSSGLGIATPIENGFKFIDLNDDMIKNEKDLQFFIETLKMTHGCDEQHILQNLRFPRFNIHMKNLKDEFKDEIVPILKFDVVSNLFEFLKRKYNFR